ncbi:F0F1 ATP synthase subunit B [Vagococcus fluvialis]|mgnify:FL=1|jgi:F-type H+-transporting ATPase subunit b|uniref:ATP synthase subunit b n=1 Tax=Vagococcus fluvialis TaxID=2738 RepID=A0A369AY99_9ENTE|nr:F0F1 ATP synthase subunit B [Vagococcus fluvialis]MDR2278844.1 F0F1 ATP synthase subunit B [Vagococcus sp.]OTP34267.1 ATP synthase F0, B subunit [Enterococcus sp. 6C8_DIV0013]MBO0419997.1 F0F1 ATP synthase subunit B [Vagococcus fluvialis]MBO0427696.1 F0F1 ATP synthase subunit B [Vagococcus fluvialis]MBO0438113.1 F0F1 ATP synthase subunit B [Vagococcus fluvialis]
MIQQLVVANAGQGMLSTILFVTVSFLVLLLALKKFAWGPVVDMMQAREDKIASDIDNAEKSKIEADKLGKQREMELKQSRTEAQGIIAQAKETAENNAHAILLEAEEHATRIKKQAHEDLRIERERMIDEAKKEVADLSVEIASKILKKELSASTHQELIQSSIEKLGVDEDE